VSWTAATQVNSSTTTAWLVDGQGNLYVADRRNNRIERRVCYRSPRIHPLPAQPTRAVTRMIAIGRAAAVLALMLAAGVHPCRGPGVPRRRVPTARNKSDTW